MKYCALGRADLTVWFLLRSFFPKTNPPKELGGEESWCCPGQQPILSLEFFVVGVCDFCRNQ